MCGGLGVWMIRPPQSPTAFRLTRFGDDRDRNTDKMLFMVDSSGSFQRLIVLMAALPAFTLASGNERAAASPAPMAALIRISCGGVAAGGWSADTLAEGGEGYSSPTGVETENIPNAAPERIYQHERFGPDFSYSIPASAPPPGKSYTVRLHFAELFDRGPGQRVFNVAINDKEALSGLDVFAETVGTNKPLIKDFPGVLPNAEGNIEIGFTAVPGHKDENAAINGIEVLADGFAPVYTPPPPQHFLFQDPTQPTEKRVDDLVSRMKLQEKIAQMRYTAPGIQRLGVPPYNWWNEALHGVARAGVATVFPQAIGLAGTWDTDLHFRMASAISDEARAKYNGAIARGNHGQYFGLDFWSPNINIFRDPRWGRGQETYGEDPYLTGCMAVAFIKGMQGDDPRYLKVVATAKHLAVHSGPESLRHVFDARPSPYDLQDTYLPAFEAAVRQGHVRSVMGAYNSVNGVPACASAFLLQETLRDQWGFQGYVVSDCGAIGDIFGGHHYAHDAAEAAADAVRAGCDLACDSAYDALGDAVRRGLIREDELDRSVKRLFTARFDLGMFDPPAMVPFSAIRPGVNDSPPHRALAAQVARESIVLLKNDRNLLPLAKSAASIAVIGPNANDARVLLGNYNGDTSHGVTILEGISRKLGPGATVGYERGCDVLSSSKIGFDAAVALAQKSDLVIVVMGISQRVEGEEGSGGISGDRTDLGLPGVQNDLLQSLVATGKPVVLVLLNASALAVNWASDHVPAIVEAWYPGEEGGTAVADVLFGDYNPAGRLPITFYRSPDGLPPLTDYAMKGRTYRYYPGKPLYPFGFGLSYTQFDYSNLRLPQTVIASQASVTVTVRNAGSRAGDEVAELYLRPVPAQGGSRLIAPDQPMPRLVLAGFQRVHLNPGESKDVSFSLTPYQLHLVNAKGERTLDPGQWQVFVGGHQPMITDGGAADPTCVSAIMKTQ